MLRASEFAISAKMCAQTTIREYFEFLKVLTYVKGAKYLMQGWRSPETNKRIRVPMKIKTLYFCFSKE